MEPFICKSLDISDIRLNNGNIVRPDGFGVLLFTKGRGSVICNDATYDLQEHILFVFTPFSTFYLKEEMTDLEGWVLKADARIILMLLADVPVEKRVAMSQHPCVKISEQKGKLLENLIRILWSKQKEHSRPLIENIQEKELFLLGQALCLEIIQVYFESMQISGLPAKRGNILFNKFVSSVYVNCHTQRTVAFYAKQLNISAGRFSAVIREVSGKSPMHWIELFTMTKIRRMLSDSEASIKEITDSMAFPDQSTFGRYFKAHEGISPSEYRARLTGRLSGAQ